MNTITKDKQYFKFCSYGLLKNLRFFDAFIVLFLIDKGMSFTQIGTMYALREIFTNIFEIPSGIIADSYGRKFSLAGSFIIYIVSFLLFYISSEFAFFLIAFILYGIADSFRTGTHKGMIMDYLKINNWETKKINYYGHTRSWSQIGSALSSIIAGIIVFYTGNYQNIFLYSIVPYLINLMLVLSYPEELDGPVKRDGERLKFNSLSTIKILISTIKKPNVLKIINTSASHSAYLRAVKDYIQPIMLNVALLIPLLNNIDTDKKNGLFIGVFYFVIYLITSFASRQSSKIASANEKNITYITLILGFIFGIACGIFYINNLWVIATIAFTGIYIVENIRKPILTGYISDNVPNDILVSVISVQSILRTILTSIFALAFGIIADSYGIGISFISISAFLILFTVIVNVIFRRDDI